MTTALRITDQYIADHPKSRALHAQARAVIPGGIAHDVRHMSPFPLTMERASGAY